MQLQEKVHSCTGHYFAMKIWEKSLLLNQKFLLLKKQNYAEISIHSSTKMSPLFAKNK